MTPLERPIIFVGAPRSGTTVIFNVFAAHPSLAWFSQHLSRLPRWPSVSALARIADLDDRFRKSIDRSDRTRGRLEKLRVGPSEAYGVWRHYCGEQFLFDFLRDARAEEEERRRMRELVGKVRRWQGKDRFATKITGPARIGYLDSIFDEPLYVHVIRDGRAVVASLLDVHFWKGGWRETHPAWEGGFNDADLERLHQLDDSPVALAALQWRAIVAGAREEAAMHARERYAEVRYEDFVADAPGVLAELARFSGLPDSSRPAEFLAGRVELGNMNYRWRERLSAEDGQVLEQLLEDYLEELGYAGTPRPTAAERRVARPFSTDSRQL